MIMARDTRKAALLRSFPPIAARDARVLVLGSMPSVASLAKREYYGHPQNAFWPLMGRLFGAGRDMPYAERKRVLNACGVAACHREGSLDASIRGEVVNDFEAFFRRHHRIRTVFFNGRYAEAIFRRHVLSSIAELGRDFRYVRLPSTSPAHAGRTFEEKLEAWEAVRSALDTCCKSGRGGDKDKGRRNRYA
jgi:TDG/mug DNA glycosylase family protein